jgi:signal peptidase II
VTKAERTIGTPGFEPADEPVDDQDNDGADQRGGDAPDASAEPAAGTGTGAEPEAPPGADTAAGGPARAEDAATARADAGTGAGEGAEGVEGAEAGAGESGGDEAGAARRGKRRVPVLFGVAVLAYLLDIVSKTLVVHHLEKDRSSIQLLGQYLQLEAVRNSGAAFGIGQGMTIVFTLIALIVIGVIARLSRRLYSVPWAVALGLLLGGALGNLTDRIFRSPGVFRGAVVDFIAPKDFAVFNLADSAIVCGGVLIVWLSFRGLDPDGSIHRD